MNKIQDNKPFYLENDYAVGSNIVTEIWTSTMTADSFNMTVNFRTVRTDFIYQFARTTFINEYYSI